MCGFDTEIPSAPAMGQPVVESMDTNAKPPDLLAEVKVEPGQLKQELAREEQEDVKVPQLQSSQTPPQQQRLPPPGPPNDLPLPAAVPQEESDTKVDSNRQSHHGNNGHHHPSSHRPDSKEDSHRHRHEKSSDNKSHRDDRRSDKHRSSREDENRHRNRYIIYESTEHIYIYLINIDRERYIRRLYRGLRLPVIDVPNNWL